MTPPESTQGLSLVEAMGAVLRYRRLVLATALGFAVLMAGWALSRPRTYTSTASFTPQATRSQIGSLGGLAAQLGVVIPPSTDNQSPSFYADLLRSRTVLEPLVGIPVSFDWKGKTYRGTFIELAKVPGADLPQKRDAAVRILRVAMAITVAPRTGVVQVQTTTRFPQLSAILTDSALGLLNSFNVNTRRSQAAAQRQFLQQRLAAVSMELRDAENALQSFAERNRGGVRTAPQLVTQEERLNRAVLMHSQVHGSLAQALEQAKLDEIRDTPLITVIEQAAVPVHADPRGLVMTTFLAFFVGLFLGAVVALLRHAVAANRKERPESFAELSAEFAAARADLRRMVWPIKRAPAGGNGSG